jgi:hypothetical protein
MIWSKNYAMIVEKIKIKMTAADAQDTSRWFEMNFEKLYFRSELVSIL